MSSGSSLPNALAVEGGEPVDHDRAVALLERAHRPLDRGGLSHVGQPVESLRHANHPALASERLPRLDEALRFARGTEHARWPRLLEQVECEQLHGLVIIDERQQHVAWRRSQRRRDRRIALANEREVRGVVAAAVSFRQRASDAEQQRMLDLTRLEEWPGGVKKRRGVIKVVELERRHGCAR